MNNRGSILIITTAFVFGFTALGVASIYLAGQENQFAEREILSNQAFWLADGAAEQARNKLATSTIPAGGYSSGTIVMNNNSNYSFNITGADPYTIVATASVTSPVNTMIRTVQAVIENFSGITHNSAAMYSGTIDHSGAVSNGNLADGATQNTGLDAQDVFGTSLPNVEALATTTYNNGATIPSPLVVSGITVIKTTSALTLSDVKSTSGALLIIDTSAAATTPTISLTGSTGSDTFNGIIYVLGNLYEDKGPSIDGAVYVQGDLSFHDSGGGNDGTITGNSGDIANVGTLLSNHLYINSWQECKNSTCT